MTSLPQPPEAVKHRLNFFDISFRIIDTGIELKPDEQDERVELNPDHQDDQRAYRAVNLVVRRKVVDIIIKAHGGKYCQCSCHNGPGIQEFPFYLIGRAITIEQRDGKEKHRDHNNPARKSYHNNPKMSLAVNM